MLILPRHTVFSQDSLLLMQTLTLVVPCYNESETLHAFMEEVLRVSRELSDIQMELIFINDGSRDNTLEGIKALAARYPQVRYISFSRNFGKESAILAGLKQASGDYVAVMDADLQDPPSLLPQLLCAVREEGYDCAGTRRMNRKGEPPIRSFFARCFYRVINLISDTKLVDGARDYKLLSRKALQALLSVQEYCRFSKGLYEWIGFRTKWFEYENIARVAGESKWSFWKLFKYSLEGIQAFSTTPLVLAAMLGLSFMAISLLAITLLALRQFVYHNSVDGWTSLICAMLLLSGVQLFCLGIFGQYLAKIYLEVKKRPHYLIAEESATQHHEQAQP